MGAECTWGGEKMSLLSLFSTFTATQDPRPLPSLAAFLWLLSAPGIGPFPVIPSLELVCLACLSLLQLLPLALAPLLLPESFRCWLPVLPFPAAASWLTVCPWGCTPAVLL